MTPMEWKRHLQENNGFHVLGPRTPFGLRCLSCERMHTDPFEFEKYICSGAKVDIHYRVVEEVNDVMRGIEL